jgi:hypothetical protein
MYEPKSFNKEDKTFDSFFLGKIKMISIRTSLNVAGGSYSAKGKKGSSSVDFITPKNIAKIAKELDFKVHLSSDWSIVGKKGYGELVTPEELDNLLMQYSNYLIENNQEIIVKNYI